MRTWIIATPDPDWREMRQNRQHLGACHYWCTNPSALLSFIETLENAIGKTADKQMLPMQPGDVQDTFGR